MAEDAHPTVGGSAVGCSPAATRAIAEHRTAGLTDYHFDLVRMVAEGALLAALMPFSEWDEDGRRRQLS
jgi:hypothetical protein